MEKLIASIEQFPPESKSLESAPRFLSLDVFRGITICLMIIVNTPGKGASLYSYLVHAHWFGFTLADLVFPSFLFAVGNALSFAINKPQYSHQSTFLKKVIKRTLLIFLIGYLMYWFPFVQISSDGSWILKPISDTRIMGVLQRIALCYLFASVIIRYFSKYTTYFIALVLLIGYWALLYFFGTPGQELTMAGNAITRFDIFLLGESHVYRRDVIPFDPEGILSTIPSIVNVLAGFWVGIFLQRNGKSYPALLQVMVIGSVLIAIALWWSLIFPISKKLWTSSFVLYTVGIDMLILCVLMYIIEIRQWKFGVKFFTVFGKNPLFIYLLSELLLITLTLIRVSENQSVFEWISVNLFQAVFHGSFGSLVTAIVFMMVCWLIGWGLDRKRIYLKI